MTLNQPDTELWELADLRSAIQRGKEDLENGRISTTTAEEVKARLRQFTANRKASKILILS